MLPESLAKNADEWHRIRSEQGLTDDFDIDGFENLLPSCRPCNSRKSGTPLALGRTAIELGVAGRAKPHLSEKVSLPLNMKDGLRLISEDNTKVLVSSLGEFQDAIQKGFSTCSNFERDVAYQRFERPLAFLQVLKAAKFAEQSFMDDPRRGLSDISLLPATLLFVTEDMTSDEAFAGQRSRLDGKSIQDLVENGEATVKEVGSEMLAVQYDHGRTFMFEMMRADVNADGIEDMVIHWGGGPIRGTYRTASVVVLTRRSQDEMFSCVSVEGLHSAR